MEILALGGETTDGVSGVTSELGKKFTEISWIRTNIQRFMGEDDTDSPPAILPNLESLVSDTDSTSEKTQTFIQNCMDAEVGEQHIGEKFLYYLFIISYSKKFFL